MKNPRQIIRLLLTLMFIYGMMFFTFEKTAVFWYLYTFTLLIVMSVAILSEDFDDELPTWKYLIFGIGYGTITYGLIRLGYIILTMMDDRYSSTISNFLASYGPNNIWHFLLLIFIIVVGEELFWRGFVQQQLKQYVSVTLSVLITSVLFALSVAISGFILGATAALIVGIIFGFLYEWKKSMPLIIVSHEVFILLLFLILPLS